MEPQHARLIRRRYPNATEALDAIARLQADPDLTAVTSTRSHATGDVTVHAWVHKLHTARARALLNRKR